MVNSLVTLASDAYYFFGRNGTTATTLSAFKSTAPDTSWASIATKTGFTTAILTIAGCQSNSTIHLLVQDGTAATSVATKYVSFDALTDTFLATTETVAAAQSNAGQAGSNPVSCAVVVRSNGEVVALYNGLQTKTSGTFRARVYYRRRTAVNTWSTETQVDGNVARDSYGVLAALGASDRVHFVYHDNTVGGVQRHLTSANVLGTISAAFYTTTVPASDIVSFDDAGTIRHVAFHSIGTAHRWASADNPTISTASYSGGSGSVRGVDDSQNVYALYVLPADGDLYIKSSSDDGATWGSATNVFTGTISTSGDTSVSKNQTAYQRGSSVVFPYVVNDNGTLKYNEYLIRTVVISNVGTANGVGAATAVGAAIKAAPGTAAGTGAATATGTGIVSAATGGATELVISTTSNDAIPFGHSYFQSSLQTFLAAGTAIASVKVWLSKTGAPADGSRCVIMSVDASHLPTGSLAYANNTISSSLLTATAAEFEFTFTPPVTVTEGSRYGFALERSGAYNDSNYALAATNLSNPFAGGQFTVLEAGSWNNTDYISYDSRSSVTFGSAAVGGVGAATATGQAVTFRAGNAAGIGAANAVGEAVLPSTTDGAGQAAGFGAASAVGTAFVSGGGIAVGTGTATAVGEEAPTGPISFLRPDGDTTLDGWTNQAGGTSNIYQSIDEASASDSDFVQSPTIAVGAATTLAIGDFAGGTAIEWGGSTGDFRGKLAQNFIAMGASIKTVRVKLAKVASPNDLIRAKIFTADVSHLPATQVGGVSNSVLAFNLSGTLTIIDFGFFPVPVTEGSEYCVVFERSTTAGDDTNKYSCTADNSNPYASGQIHSWNGTAWVSSLTTTDLISEIYFLPASTVSTGNMANADELGFGTTSFQKVSQSFITVGTTISKVRFKLKKTGSLTDGVQIKILTVDGDHKPLAQIGVTSNVLNNTSITTTLAVYEFTFATPVTVTSGVEYCFVMERTGAMDPANTYATVLDTTGAYTAGLLHYYSDLEGGSWRSDYAPYYDTPSEIDFAVEPAATLKVRLFESSTQIAEWTHTDVPETFATAEQTLTEPQLAAITNLSDLFIELDDNQGSVYRFPVSNPAADAGYLKLRYRYKKLVA